MAQTSTMYRFKIKLSDVDRNLYQTVELRVAMHPSESIPFLVTRILAYCLNAQDGLELTQGIAAAEEPALQVKDLTGSLLLWIDIGNPTARRLHKASKSAKRVRLYTYRDIELLKKEAATETIHRVGEIEVFALEQKFLNQIGETLERDNAWDLLHDDGEISLTVNDRTLQGDIRPHRLA